MCPAKTQRRGAQARRGKPQFWAVAVGSAHSSSDGPRHARRPPTYMKLVSLILCPCCPRPTFSGRARAYKPAGAGIPHSLRFSARYEQAAGERPVLGARRFNSEASWGGHTVRARGVRFRIGVQRRCVTCGCGRHPPRTDPRVRWPRASWPRERLRRLGSHGCTVSLCPLAALFNRNHARWNLSRRAVRGNHRRLSGRPATGKRGAAGGGGVSVMRRNGHRFKRQVWSPK